MISKKAQKLLKKLPRFVQLAAVAADESPAFGTMLGCSGKTRVSIKLPGNYRLVKDRESETVVWVGSHESYNKLVTRGGTF